MEFVVGRSFKVGYEMIMIETFKVIYSFISVNLVLLSEQLKGHTYQI